MQIYAELQVNPTHLIEVKRLKHLLNVFICCWAQVFQVKKLLKLMQGKLAWRTLRHEFLVPLVTLSGTQFLNGFSIHVPHCKAKEMNTSLKNSGGLLSWMQKQAGWILKHQGNSQCPKSVAR